MDVDLSFYTFWLLIIPMLSFWKARYQQLQATLNRYSAYRLTRAVVRRMGDDSLSLVASGVAFHIFLSLFPALATAISLYGLLFDAGDIREQILNLQDFLPSEVLALMAERANNLVANQDSTLTWGLVIGIGLSLWSANRAMKAIAQALNIAYETTENRGFIKKNLVTLLLTLLSTLVFIVVLFIVVVVPVFVSVFLKAQVAEVLTTVGSWMIFICVLLGLFWILYAYAPARHHRPWRCLFPGALSSALLVVIASSGFSLYVANFGKYDQQYGALGAVVITLLWLYLGSFIFLLGAEINAQVSTRTRGNQPRNPAQKLAERSGG